MNKTQNTQDPRYSTQSIKIVRTVAAPTKYNGPQLTRYTQQLSIVEGSISEGELHLVTIGRQGGFPAVLTHTSQGNYLLEICSDRGWSTESVRLAPVQR